MGQIRMPMYRFHSHRFYTPQTLLMEYVLYIGLFLAMTGDTKQPVGVLVEARGAGRAKSDPHCTTPLPRHTMDHGIKECR